MVVMAYTSLPISPTTSGELVLRICGTQRDGQIVRLRTAKCLVGSAPECDLRLRSRHVAPRHCLILRGAGGTVVRSWSRDTRLNGVVFDDARLSPGDRLSIGPIDFEVVEANAPILEDLSSKDAIPSPPPSPEPQATPLQDQERISYLLRRTQQLQTGRQENRQRVRRLLQSLRRSQEQVRRLDSEGNLLITDRDALAAKYAEQQARLLRALDQRDEELKIRRQELAEKEKAWAEKTACFEAKTAELQAALEEQSRRQENCSESPDGAAAVEEQKAKAEALALALEQRQKRLESRELELQQRGDALNGRAEELEDARKGLEVQTAELEHARAQQETLAKELDARANRVARQEEEIRRQASAVETEAKELDETRAEFERTENESLVQIRAREEKLKTREAALEQLQAALEADREKLESQSQQRQVESMNHVAAAVNQQPATSGSAPGAATTQAAQPHAPEEDSIQQYMAQLLQRVRGGSQKESTGTAPTHEEPQPRYTPNQPAAANLPSCNFDEARDESTAEMSPRTAAPENAVGLAAMRSLANMSATHALGTHTQKLLTKSCRIRLLLMVLALTSSAFLFEMRSLFHIGDYSLYGAIGCLVAAAFWGSHFVLLLARLTTHRASQLAMHAADGAMPSEDASLVASQEIVESPESAEPFGPT